MAYHDSYDDGEEIYIRCDGCGVVDLDVERCIHQGCETHLHASCADQCEACKQVMCEEHSLTFGNCTFCPVCYYDALKLNVPEIKEEEFERWIVRSPV